MPAIQGITAQGEEQNSRVTAMELWSKQIELNKLKKEMNKGDFSDSNKATKLQREIDNANKTEGDIKTAKTECSTCAARRYVDGSDDSSVSFQNPTHISPEMSFAKVAAHENEHVVNENAKAKKENREVVSSSVTINYAVCPECGASYSSGGLTRTTTKAKDETSNNMYSQEQDENSEETNFDMRI